MRYLKRSLSSLFGRWLSSSVGVLARLKPCVACAVVAFWPSLLPFLFFGAGFCLRLARKILDVKLILT